MKLSGVIFVVLLVLKLTGTEPVANWSWWWVTCPLWILPVIMIGVFILGLIVSLFK